jgi:diguanylate cyclase (GGDEF)-like protein
LSDLVPNNYYDVFLTQTPSAHDVSYELINFNEATNIYLAIDLSFGHILKVTLKGDKENYIFLAILMFTIYCLMSYVEIQYRLKFESRIDQLTKFGNRYSFEDFLKLNLKSKKRYASITIIDIDDFKMINDTYGHDIGDTVLKKVALTVENSIRDEDKVFRFGGEEFCIVIFSDDALECDIILERARRNIVKHEFSDPEPFKITVSGGSVVKQKYLCSELFATEIKIADKELYFSKRNEKNRLKSKT